jgi:hypothetical protein
VLQQLLVRRIELHAGRQPRQVLDRRRRLHLMTADRFDRYQRVLFSVRARVLTMHECMLKEIVYSISKRGCMMNV